jgi:MoxR-like ATPase
MDQNNEQPHDQFQQRIDTAAVIAKVQDLRDEIARVLVGQTDLVNRLLVALLADGHVLLEGVPGVAKTLCAKLLAKTIDADFSRVQFTPDLMPSDVVGTNVFNPQQASFEFRRGPIFGNIVLIDEINRAPAKTQSSLFEVMEERQVSVDASTYKMDLPFMVIATQNPIEHEGTYQLPEAQLDRFLFKLVVLYPTLDEECKILQQHHEQQSMHDALLKVRTILSKSELLELRKITQSVRVDTSIIKFICGIVAATRSNASLDLGASPRASIALMNAAKAYAAINDRDFVVPEDVLYVALPALRHRVALSAEKEIDGVLVDEVITDIIGSQEIPR